MEEMLKLELVKLQDELLQLDKAVSHISKAEQLTTELVANSREIQHKYIHQLGTIDTLQQEQAQAIKDLLAKYIDLGKKTETIAAEQLQKAMARFVEFVEQQVATTESTLRSLSEAHSTEIVEMKRLADAYRQQLARQEEMGLKHLETVLAQNSELLKESFRASQAQVAELTGAHKKQIDDVNTVFQSYVDLSDSTSKLARDIRDVNFPERLTALHDDVADFKTTVRNTFARIEALERSVAKVNAVDWARISALNEIANGQQKQIQRLTWLVIGGIAVGVLGVIVGVV